MEGALQVLLPTVEQAEGETLECCLTAELILMEGICPRSFVADLGLVRLNGACWPQSGSKASRCYGLRGSVSVPAQPGSPRISATMCMSSAHSC